MAEKRGRMALVYDFDRALALDGVPVVGAVAGGDSEAGALREKVDARVSAEDGDRELVRMRTIMEEADEAGVEVTRETLREQGARLELFEGLADGSWFDRIDAWAEERKVSVEHYAISSGIRETIEGCAVGSRFRQIFASTFTYEAGTAKWPLVAMNDGRRGECLLQVAREITEHAGDLERASEDHPATLYCTIFLGGRKTDYEGIRRMKIRADQTVAVQRPDEPPEAREEEMKLLSREYVDAVLPADYSAGGGLDLFVRAKIEWTSRKYHWQFIHF